MSTFQPSAAIVDENLIKADLRDVETEIISSTAEEDETAVKTEVDEATLFVGDLPPEITVLELSELFQPFGAIVDIQLKIIRGIKFPFGYAFIKFHNKDDAVAAFEKLNGNIVCGGCCLRLGWAKRNKRLHVANGT